MRLVLVAGLLIGTACAYGDELVLVAGAGRGPAVEGELLEPFGVEFHKGAMYFVEMAPSHRLRVMTEARELLTLAGKVKQAGYAGDGGPAREALLNGPHNLAVLSDGTIFIADTFNHSVRVYHPKTQTLDTFAGNGKAGFAGDGGPARQAQFNQAYCVALDPAEKMLIVTDLGNRRIRGIELATGMIRTLAGNGERGVPQDGGKATQQPLVDPRAAVMDKEGRLWILERSGHALRVVLPDGAIRTVAGNGKRGNALGAARQAVFDGPKHLCIDRDGTVLIADTENHRIVRYDPNTETISLVAGTGKPGAAGVGGDPQQAQLNRPHGVTVHPVTGEIYIADSSNHRIVKIVRTGPSKQD